MKHRGRPREYKDGVRKFTTSIPKKLHDEFVKAWEKLGSSNVSRGVQDALYLWLSTRASMTLAEFAPTFLELDPRFRAALVKLSKVHGTTPSTFAQTIVERFLEDATPKEIA